MALDIIEYAIVFIAFIAVRYCGSMSGKCVEKSFNNRADTLERSSLRNTSLIFGLLSIVAIVILGMVIISIESFKII